MRSEGNGSSSALSVSRVRVAAMLAGGVAVAIVVGVLAAPRYAPLAGWDAAALIFAGWVWVPITRFDADATSRHAVQEEPGRAATSVIVISAGLASLAAIGVLLLQSRSASDTTQNLSAGFALLSVAVSWFAVHTLFTLRYARLYYGGTAGGIDFNQDAKPRYLDFAYLALTIGMTFQVSDTDLQTGPIRMTALRQALLSYLFGAVILASTINLIVALGTQGGG